MKKTLNIILGAVVLISLASAAIAGPTTDRLKSGANQFAKSPLNVSDSIKEEFEKAEFKPFGVVGGTLKGTFYFLKDMTMGLFKMITLNVGPLQETKE